VRIEFVATEAGTVEENGVVSCGASNASSEADFHYVNLQANSEQANSDGVYFEIDGQLNSECGLVERAYLEEEKLVLRLKRGVTSYPELTEVVVHLDLPQAERAALAGGLRRVLGLCSLSLETSA